MEPTSSHQLKPHIVNEINEYLKENDLKKLPRAPQGQSAKNIRILASKQILIRIANNEKEMNNLTRRINNMADARDVIKNNGFTELKVPRASLIGNHLVETLLPCTKGVFFGSMYYYAQHHQHFNKAAAEFAKFLVQTTLNDIIGSKNNWMKSHFPNGFPRYDNIQIYEHEKKGITKYKIGLIDLETFKKEPINGNQAFLAAKKAILLFPYNYEIIMDALQNDYNFKELELEMLNNYRSDALRAIVEIYKKHFDFILNQAINPFPQYLDLTEERNQLIEELAKKVFKYDQKLGQIFLYRLQSQNIDFYENELHETEKLSSAIIRMNLLGDNPSEALDFLKRQVFPQTIRDVCEFMQDRILISKNQNSITNFASMAKRFCFFKKPAPQELFTIKRKTDMKSYSFSAKRIVKASEMEITEIDSFFTDMIVKSEFVKGPHQLTVQSLLLNLFEKKGLVANVFVEDTSTTAFF